jgi:hypothetical protein
MRHIEVDDVLPVHHVGGTILPKVPDDLHFDHDMCFIGCNIG